MPPPAAAGGGTPLRGMPSIKEMRELLQAQGGPRNLSSQVTAVHPHADTLLLHCGWRHDAVPEGAWVKPDARCL